MALLLSYTLNLIDYILTAYWVNLYGTEIEGNPLMRWAFENNVAWAVKIFGVGVAFTALGICIHKQPKYKWTSYLLVTVYSLILTYHLFIILLF